jgi:hypothetical protein
MKSVFKPVVAALVEAMEFEAAMIKARHRLDPRDLGTAWPTR